MGGWLLPWIDPYATTQQAREYRKVFDDIYREVLADSDFNGAGSVLGEAYMDLLGCETRLRHMYVFRPAAAGKWPVVVAFHGWLGNMKAQAWIWRALADRNQCAVILPTFRNGIWNGAEAEAMLDEVMRFIDESPDLDSGRIVVAGMSNGASGTTAWAKHHRNRFAGLVYVVPALEGTEDATGLPEAVVNIPILVVHGGADTRIPPDFIQRWCKLMTLAGCDVAAIAYPGQGHLLMMTARERFLRDVGDWINGKFAAAAVETIN